MDALVQAMSNQQLEQMKADHPDNETIVKLVDGILEVREREAKQAELDAKFSKEIEKIIAKLPHPDSIHNIYLAWGEVEVPTGEPELVYFREGIPLSELPPDGQEQIEAGIITQVERTPTTKVEKWSVTLNKGFVIKGSGNGSKPTTNKRAITVEKRQGNTLVAVGNFPNGQAAADYLKINTGANSANRVLQGEGYILTPYTGTEYTT